MTGFHIRFQYHSMVACLGAPQLCDPLGRLPVLHLGIVQARGDQYIRIHRFVAVSSLVIFGCITIFVFRPWIVMFLLLVFFGHRHPPTLDETPIDHKRIALGIITLLIFALSFSPRPFEFL